MKRSSGSRRIGRSLFPTAALLVMSGLAACKGRRPGSALKDNELGPTRNQQQNGTCWLYAMGTALNGTLARANARLVMRAMGLSVGDPFGFAMVSSSNVPWTINDYYWHDINDGGEFTENDLSAITAWQNDELADQLTFYKSDLIKFAKSGDNAVQLPVISIDAMIYAYYLKSFSDWSNSWWPVAYNGEGGDADSFNAIYQKALFPVALFPDVDASSADSQAAKAACQGISGCDPGNITSIINAADLYHKSPRAQQTFFQNAIEVPFSVPPAFRTTLRNGKLHYPVLDDDFQFQFRGKTYTRATIASAFDLPADIGMTQWLGGRVATALSSAGRLFSSHWSASGLAFPDGQAMNELVAALSLLHQPVAIGLASFNTRNGPNGLEWVGSNLLDAVTKQGHAVTSLSFVVRGGDLGLIVQNSWGEKSSRVRVFGLAKYYWSTFIPTFLLDRIAAVFAKAHHGDCNALDSDVRALGAAYLDLQQQGYTNFSATGRALLGYLTQCHQVVSSSPPPSSL